MNFKPAQYTARNAGPNQPDVRYVIRESKNKRSRSVVLFVRKKAALEAGIKAGDAVRIDWDQAQGVGRLLAVNQADRRARDGKLSLIIQWPWSGDLQQMFPLPPKTAKCFVIPLPVVDASKSDGLIFNTP